MDASTKFKVIARHERRIWVCKCDKCGEVIRYIVDLPRHLRIHTRKDSFGPYCGGFMVTQRTEWEHTDNAAKKARKKAGIAEGELTMADMTDKQRDIIDNILSEYSRQAKGGTVAPSVIMLKSVVDGKFKQATTPQLKAEMRNMLLQVSALSLKMLEQL